MGARQSAEGRNCNEKVRVDENLADALTKHVSQDELKYHIERTDQLFETGRHDLAPDIGCIERSDLINYQSNKYDSHHYHGHGGEAPKYNPNKLL